MAALLQRAAGAAGSENPSSPRCPAASLVTFSTVFQTREVEGEQTVFFLANAQLYRNITKH